MNEQERAAMQQALEFLENGNFVYPTQLADDLRAALAQQPAQEPSYERGFIDGMQKQAESSVDRAVNRMALLAQERATPVKPAPPGLVGVTTVSSVSVATQHRVLTDADLDAIRKIVREGGKE